MLVGVLHLPPLPGSPRAALSIDAIAARAAEDARALAGAGYDLAMLENFGDAPFFATRVPPLTVAAMTACAAAVRAACPSLPIGINVLRNDGPAALAIAAVVGATCIRVNVLTGARVTDQGLVEGEAASLLRERRAIGAGAVRLWADVDVKHSAPLARRDGGPAETARALANEAKDTALRGLADALLVTGDGTGMAASTDTLATVRKAVPGVPIYVASGATEATLAELASACDGVIVGSALRADGIAGGAVDARRAESFARAFRAAFATRG